MIFKHSVIHPMPFLTHLSKRCRYYKWHIKYIQKVEAVKLENVVQL